MRARTVQRQDAGERAAREQFGSARHARTGPSDHTAVLMSLQRSHGNRFVQRILEARMVKSECGCGGACAICAAKQPELDLRTEFSDLNERSVDAPAPASRVLAETNVVDPLLSPPAIREAILPDDDCKNKHEGEDGGAVSATPAQAPPPAPLPPPAPVAPAAPPAITWGAASYSSDNGNGASTTVEQAFTPSYTATQDAAAGVWRMGLTSITGGATITVHTGGSRDPTTSPPTTEAEAQQAVTVMKGYYARGSRGAWHTEGASKTHEEHHYREWKCSAEHYWAIAGPAITALTTPVAGAANAAAAVAAMKPSADSTIASFKTAARNYWFTLADNASSRPYAAGQAVLNGAVTNVQALAATKSWTVEAGTTATSGTEPPCYQAFAAYTP